MKHLELPGMADLRAAAFDDDPLTIAVIDGPPDLDHPCFQGADVAIVDRPWDARVHADPGFVQHATYVASVLFGQPGTSVEGIVPHARGLLIPAGFDETTGDLDLLRLARAVEHAVNLGADLIHFAFCLPTATGAPDERFNQSVQRALAMDVGIVAPVGNDANECQCEPAIAPGVLAAGALDPDGRPFDYNNSGGILREQAVYTLGDYPAAIDNGEVKAYHGSSCAAPILTGVVALLLGRAKRVHGRATFDEVRAAILSTAVPLAPAFKDAPPLRGVLDIGAAARALGVAGLTPSIEPSVLPAPRPTYVFAIGTPDYELPDEVTDRYFAERMVDPGDRRAMVDYLRANPEDATRLTWLLTDRAAPLYAIKPAEGFADEIHAHLLEILAASLGLGDIAVERMSLPGVAFPGATSTLRSGEPVADVLVADLRGMHAWTTARVVDDAVSASGLSPAAVTPLAHEVLSAIYAEPTAGMRGIDRARNFAGTNAFQVIRAVGFATVMHMRLVGVYLEPSAFCRVGSVCWDVVIRFGDEENALRGDLECRFTVDVSDLHPVLVGALRTRRRPRSPEPIR
ncbi:MAG: S8 family serine peptidase [Dehalococcoidia bacterium]